MKRGCSKCSGLQKTNLHRQAMFSQGTANVGDIRRLEGGHLISGYAASSPLIYIKQQHTHLPV